MLLSNLKQWYRIKLTLSLSLSLSELYGEFLQSQERDLQCKSNIVQKGKWFKLNFNTLK